MNDGQIVFPGASSVLRPIIIRQFSGAFSCLGSGNDTAGIPVQTIADGGAEQLQAFLADASLIQQIGDHSIIYGLLAGLPLLG